MDKFIKVQAVQAGPFNVNQNLVDFRIRGSDVYDLADSYVNLLCSLPVVTETTTGGGTGIYNFNGQLKASAEMNVQNVALVKNAAMDCSKAGRIENLRRVDILKQNLAIYTKSLMEERDESYEKFTNFRDQFGQKQEYGLFTQINKTGDVKSQYQQQVPVQVALSDIFEFCRTREYDNGRAGGETRIHLELNAPTDVADDQSAGGSVTKLSVRQTMLDADIQAELKAGVVGGGSNNAFFLGATTAGKEILLKSLDQLPYHVGQKVLVSAVGAVPPANVTDAPVVISSIVWDRENVLGKGAGAVQLNFETDWGGLTAGQNYNSISLKPALASARLQIDACELVLKKVTQPQGISQINYNTYATEEQNALGATTYQNLFNVEAEATNAFFTFPDSADLLSHNADISSWRLRLNQQDLTDRDVVHKSPLANDRLAMTLNSMGYGLRNLTRNSGKTQAATFEGTYSDATFSSIVIANPLFQTDHMKLLQANINAGGAGVKKIALFKQLPRVFSY
jgi:hypothetical protein